MRASSPPVLPDAPVSALGLYLHVPFCASICRYCDFTRGLLDPELKGQYVRALSREIADVGLKIQQGRYPVGSVASHHPLTDTIYFGGGTPSLLEPAEVGRIVSACRAAFAVSPDAEVTLEANPETVSLERMDGYREAGVNRVSLGVQSFRDEELERLGRIHTAPRAAEALRAVRAAGFDNVSLDLMLWLPGQSVAECEASVAALADLRPEHASLYLLEPHASAPLGEEMSRRGWTLAPEDDAAEMYDRAIDRLERAGYEHYEISNLARPGRRSRHNLKYWTDGEWLGFGCGAHSTLAGVRWKNVPGTAEYVRRIEARHGAATGIRVLSPAQRVEEWLFMGLRLIEGIDLRDVTGHHAVDVWERHGERLQDYVDAGLLVREGERLRLTRRGLLLSNEVMAVFIDPIVR